MNKTIVSLVKDNNDHIYIEKILIDSFYDYRD